MPNIFQQASRPASWRKDFHNQATRFSLKATHHPRGRGSPEQLAFTHTLLSGGGVGKGLASDINGRLRIAGSLFQDIKRVKLEGVNTECRLVTLIFDDLITSDEATVLDLTTLKRRSRPILSDISPDYIAIVELQAMTNVPHADGGKQVCPHIHVPIFGPKLCDRAYAVVDRVNQRLGQLSNGMQPAHVTEAAADLTALRRMLTYPLKPPDKNKTLYISADGSRSNMHESTKGDRMIRYERQLELLSQLDLRQLLFAGGKGRPIKTAAFREAGAIRRTPGAATEIDEFWRTWRQQTKTTRFARPIII